jgi:hypothetical protein
MMMFVLRKSIKVCSFIIIASILFGCNIDGVTNSDKKQKSPQCGEPLGTYKLSINWDENSEATLYRIKISSWPTRKSEFCGFWVSKKGQELPFHIIGREPLTVLLELPYTDNSWRLVMLNMDESIISGESLWETWGATRQVGYFEIYR